MLEILGFGLVLNIVMKIVVLIHSILDSVFRTGDTVYWLGKTKEIVKGKKTFEQKYALFIPYFNAYKVFRFYAVYGYTADFLIMRMVYNNLTYKKLDEN